MNGIDRILGAKSLFLDSDILFILLILSKFLFLCAGAEVRRLERMNGIDGMIESRDLSLLSNVVQLRLVHVTTYVVVSPTDVDRGDVGWPTSVMLPSGLSSSE